MKYTLYIDESGIANLTEAKGGRYFVLVGLAIEETIDHELSSYFRNIKRRHGINLEKNFHAFDFFELKESSLYCNNNKAKKFVDSLCEFVETAPFELFAFVVNKQDIIDKLQTKDTYKFRTHKHDKEIAYELLARAIFLSFASFLRKNKAQGAIVAESRRGSDKVLLRTFLDAQEESLFHTKKYKRYSQLFRNKIVSLCFENKSGLNGGLELADIHSYTLFQKVNKKIPTLEKRGVKKLWNIVSKKMKLDKRKNPLVLTAREMNEVGKDRIDKISKTIKDRIAAYSDL